MSFPCFVKPLFSAGSIGAKKICHKDDLAAYFTQSNLLNVCDKQERCNISRNNTKFLICGSPDCIELDLQAQAILALDGSRLKLLFIKI